MNENTPYSIRLTVGQWRIIQRHIYARDHTDPDMHSLRALFHEIRKMDERMKDVKDN